MRTYLSIIAASVLLVLGGCKAAGPEYVPTGTIRELMDSLLDPNADFVWGSVATIVAVPPSADLVSVPDSGAQPSF